MLIVSRKVIAPITFVAFALALAFNSASRAQDDLPPNGENNVWYKDNDADTVIVFVHGLLSDSRSAWAYEDENDPSKNTNWPRLIQDDPTFEDAAIFLGGFYTEIDSGKYNMREASIELYRELAVEGVLDKPKIIFITHSTGGIVVRHMLVRKTEKFADKKVGLVLVASPSLGSRDADRLSVIAKLAKHKLGQELQWDSPFLSELDKNFKNLVNERKLMGLVGTEWLEHHYVGGTLGKAFGLAREEVLVEDESAARYFGEPIRLPNTTHTTAAKPNGRRHPAHKNLRFFYQEEFLPASQPAAKEVSWDSTTNINRQGIATDSGINTSGGDVTANDRSSQAEPISEPISKSEATGSLAVDQVAAIDAATMTESVPPVEDVPATKAAADHRAKRNEERIVLNGGEAVEITPERILLSMIGTPYTGRSDLVGVRIDGRTESLKAGEMITIQQVDRTCQVALLEIDQSKSRAAFRVRCGS